MLILLVCCEGFVFILCVFEVIDKFMFVLVLLFGIGNMFNVLISWILFVKLFVFCMIICDKCFLLIFWIDIDFFF